MNSRPERTRGRRRQVTIADVAREANVSRAAVSKVIRDAYGVSPEMRERVTRVIEQLGYRPRADARAMRGTTFTFGIEIPQLGNEFFTQIFRGVMEHLSATQYDLISVAAEDPAASMRSLESLLDRQVAGIVAISPFVDPLWLERLAQRLPLVQLGRHDVSEHFDTVTGDDRLGVQLALGHLLDLGHRRIAHITGERALDSPERTDTHSIRLTAYTAMMLDRGLKPEVHRCDGTEAGAYRVAAELVRGGDPPTAIFAGHDTLALGVLRATAERGLDARDVSVVGYDDVEMARHPLIGLTTVDQFGHRMGVEAARMLLERVEERTAPSRVQTTPELRVRRSTAPPRN
ncbi:MAG TPA: LacI family DNA-binding transcriptional regulator [Spirillospora sp.]|nr:LacI family DNA-binding transcriptional regulator [Spirillospora sp.]